MVSVLGKNVYIDTNTFINNQTIVNVDLCNLPWVNNSMVNAFYNCNNLTSVTNINQNVTNMYKTFNCCNNLVDAPVIPNSVTSMVETFWYCSSLVDAPVIPNSVTNMHRTFYECISLVNAPVIPNSVTYMDSTFHNCINLVNAPVIPNSVINMYWTFHGCTNLVNAPVIPNSVTDMSGTFCYCSSLVDAPVIPNSVTDMTDTFTGCWNLVNAPIIPNSVIWMRMAFYNCSNMILNSSNVNIPNCKYMPECFYNCNSITSINLNAPNCTNMYECFQMCNSLTDATIYAPSCIDMTDMFRFSNNLVNVHGNFESAKRFSNTFYKCFKLKYVETLGNSATFLTNTFSNCSSLTDSPVIPNSVTSMYQTFSGCSSLVNAPVIPNSVTNVRGTFQNCTNLQGNIYIKSENITIATNCFNVTSLTKNVYIPFTYENGVNTATYNSFISAGYDTSGTQHGVYLKDLSEVAMLCAWRDTEHNITIYTLSDSPSVGDRIFRNDGSSYGVSENIGSSLYVKNNNIVSTSPSENKVVFYASSSGVLTDTITCNCIRYAQGDIYTLTPLSISITSLDPNSKGSLTVDRYVNNVYDGGWYTSFTTDSSGNVNNAIYIPKDETLRYGFMIDETNNAYTGWNCISIGNNAYQGYIELQSDIWTGYFNDTLAGVSIPITNNITIHMMSPEEEKAIWGVDDTQYTITQSGSTIYLNTYIGTNTSVVVPRSKS